MKFARHWMIWIAVLVLGLAFAMPAAAQEEDDSVIYKKKTVYNFDDDTITGDLTRPDQEFLTGRKMARHKSLIRIRENFKNRVLKSVKDL
jgi:hypothetical protein